MSNAVTAPASPQHSEAAPDLRHCACGIVYTRAEWKKLANPRRWTLDGQRLELRDCSCGSTISTVVP